MFPWPTWVSIPSPRCCVTDTVSDCAKSKVILGTRASLTVGRVVRMVNARETETWSQTTSTPADHGPWEQRRGWAARTTGISLLWRLAPNSGAREGFNYLSVPTKAECCSLQSVENLRKCRFLPARRYATAGTSYGPVSVCVCLSQVGVLSKRMDGIIWFLAWGLLSISPTRCFKKFRYLVQK